EGGEVRPATWPGVGPCPEVPPGRGEREQPERRAGGERVRLRAVPWGVWGEWCSTSLRPPVHADVVDEHGRRKDCIRLWIAVEVAADSKIEDHEKRLIEYPSAVRLHFAASDRVMDGIIDKESDVKGVPFDGVGVERVRGRSPHECLHMRDRRVSEIARAVYRRAGPRRSASLILHHIALAAIGP